MREPQVGEMVRATMPDGTVRDLPIVEVLCVDKRVIRLDTPGLSTWVSIGRRYQWPL